MRLTRSWTCPFLTGAGADLSKRIENMGTFACVHPPNTPSLLCLSILSPNIWTAIITTTATATLVWIWLMCTMCSLWFSLKEKCIVTCAITNANNYWKLLELLKRFFVRFKASVHLTTIKTFAEYIFEHVLFEVTVIFPSMSAWTRILM